MIESRCGILCSQCGYKDKVGCKGCLNIDLPFWGEGKPCPVKACCEAKGEEHCGGCLEFPCELLNSFAFCEKQGDGGKRIEQCRAWNKARK
jgi:hypothetical protein